MIFVQVEPNLWVWGDWYIACVGEFGDRFWLLVSSGIEYGPFLRFDAALKYAQDVAGA